MEPINMQRVIAYARIIDINDEVYDIAHQMNRTAKRWKYRPAKTVSCTFGRAGKAMSMAFSLVALAKEKHHLLNSLKPQFASGGIVGGKLNGLHAETIIIDDLKNIKPEQWQRTLVVPAKGKS